MKPVAIRHACAGRVASALAFALSVAFTSHGAAEPRFLQCHRMFAVYGDKIEDAYRRYPDSFRDGVIVATFSGLDIGSPEVREFAAHKAFCERFRSLGLDVHMCISSTVGHKDDWTAKNDFPKMVGSDGVAAQRLPCPRSLGFVAHVRDLFSRYAALKPSVIWFDDDFRMAHHPPVDFACFCDDCLKRFSDETGLAFSRKGLVGAICRDESVDGKRVRRVWRDYSARALTELVAVAAEAVRAVDGDISLGFMVCNPGGHGYAPPDFPSWIKMAKRCGGKVYFRHGSGAYTDFMPYSHDGIIRKNVSIARLCAATEGPGVVNLTEEVTSPYNRRSKSMKLTFLEVALNIGLAGADGVTYDAIKPNIDEQLRDDAIVAEMHRRDPVLQRFHALIRGKRQIGIYPFFSPDIWLENDSRRSIREMAMMGAEDWHPLLYLGIPFTFREKDASLLMLTRKSVRGMDRAMLEGWLDRGIVADGEAAAEMDRLLGRRASTSPRVAVFCRGGNGRWSNDAWNRDASLRIKAGLDRLAGGRMPSRVDTAVRLAQSVWESPDGMERVVFLFNLDFDDATDVRLALDGHYAAESLDARDGRWTAFGSGDAFALPAVPAWSPAVFRFRRTLHRNKEIKHP